MAFGSTLNQSIDTNELVTEEELNNKGYATESYVDSKTTSPWKLIYNIANPSSTSIDFAYTFNELPGAFKVVYDLQNSGGTNFQISLIMGGGSSYALRENSSNGVETKVTNIFPITKVTNSANNVYLLYTSILDTYLNQVYFFIYLNSLSVGTLQITRPEFVKNFNFYYLSSL